MFAIVPPEPEVARGSASVLTTSLKISFDWNV